jgi:coronatine-insensitive protein 1
LHTLARSNSSLEELHFGVLGLGDVDVADLVTLMEKCKSLVSLKVGEIEMLDMVEVLNRASCLEELGTGSYNYLSDEGEDEAAPIALPKHLKSLSGMWSLTDGGLSMILPVAPNLRKLDLKYTLLSCEGHIQLLSQCHLLEELQV